MAHKPGFDASGRFAPKNKHGLLSGEYKSIRMATKEELMRCAHSLTRRVKDIPPDKEKDSEQYMKLSIEEKEALENRSYMQYRTDKAMRFNEDNWIYTLLDRVFGRPKQAKDDDEEKIAIVKDIDHEKRSLELSYKARENKIIKDLEQKKVYNI